MSDKRELDPKNNHPDSTEPDSKNGDFYLVQINQEAIAASLEVPQVPQEQFKVSNEAQQRILELEQELHYTRENLQTLLEELETINEEQQASNEELDTVNIKYQSKIQELTQLNNDLDNLVKSSDIGVIFLDPELRVRKFTPPATEAVSLGHKDLKRPLKDLALKIECNQLLKLVERVLENEQSIELEVKQKENNNYFLMRISSYYTQEPKNEGVIISFIKINEIKAVQFQLANALRKLKNQDQEINNFFQLSLEMLSVSNFDGYFRRINPSFTRVLGYSNKELLTQPWINFVHPDDVKGTWQEFQGLLEGNDIVGCENRYRCKDGSYRWLKWMGTSHQGLIYAIAHDLTEQKLAQELQTRQLAAIETASDGIAILNEDKFIYLNQAHLEIFGYSQPEELIGQSWRVLYESEEIARLEREVFPILMERGRWQGETTAKHRDGHTFEEELTLTFTPKGDLIYVCRDISEIKQARQQILQANVELEQRVVERTTDLTNFTARLKQLHRLATTNYERLEDLFDDYLKTGCQMFNLTTGIVSQITDNIYTILAVRSPLNLSVGLQFNCKDTYCAEVIEKQATISFYHAGAMENMKDHPVYQNLGLESFIGTPIFVNGMIFGTLHFSDTIALVQDLWSDNGEIIELMARNIGHSIAAWQSKAALQKSEKRFRSTFEQAAVGIAHVSPEGRFIRVNQRLCDIVGYDSECLIELTFQEITHPDDLTADLEYIRQVLAGEIATYSIEKRYIHCNGSIVWVNLTVSLVKDTLGEPDYFIAVMEDISERKQTEIALEESRTELKQANRAKDNFIAHISHELRTPLNSILGFSNILQKDVDLTANQLHYINIIHNSGEHLLTLINDILDFSKIKAQNIKLSPLKFNLRRFLTEIAVIFRLRTQQKGLTFLSQISPSLPIAVNADSTRLRQILYNLLTNAIKFTETGSITFKIDYIENLEPIASPRSAPSSAQNNSKYYPTSDIPQPTSTGKVRFQIEDTGIGIPADNFADIFTPFGQLNTDGRNNEGTGLGLTISQEIVQLMGSQIELESQVDQGTKFWFDLELPAVEPNLLPSLPGFIEQVPRRLRVPRKILIVDDNYQNRSLLLSYLQPFGFEIAEASNGAVGLSMAQTFQPDVVLIDLLMPIMDGKEMIARLREQPQLQNCVLIIISASSQSIATASAIDCDELLSKPVNLEQLMQLLERHLELDWLYQESITESNDHKSSTLVPPPQETLIKLLELAELGDIEEIREELNSLEALDAQYTSFVQEVRQLAVSFQQHQLEIFIQNFIDA